LWEVFCITDYLATVGCASSSGCPAKDVPSAAHADASHNDFVRESGDEEDKCEEEEGEEELPREKDPVEEAEHNAEDTCEANS
jgi:hypothetical protein